MIKSGPMILNASNTDSQFFVSVPNYSLELPTCVSNSLPTVSTWIAKEKSQIKWVQYRIAIPSKLVLFQS